MRMLPPTPELNAFIKTDSKKPPSMCYPPLTVIKLLDPLSLHGCSCRNNRRVTCPFFSMSVCNMCVMCGCVGVWDRHCTHMRVWKSEDMFGCQSWTSTWVFFLLLLTSYCSVDSMLAPKASKDTNSAPNAHVAGALPTYLPSQPFTFENITLSTMRTVTRILKFLFLEHTAE